MLDKILRKKFQQDALNESPKPQRNKFTLGNILWQGGLESRRHSLVTLQVVKLSALPVQYGTNRIFKSNHTDSNNFLYFFFLCFLFLVCFVFLLFFFLNELQK